MYGSNRNVLHVVSIFSCVTLKCSMTSAVMASISTSSTTSVTDFVITNEATRPVNDGPALGIKLVIG